ncbi:MAG: hypothetical protein GYB67_01320 [Chloroflexi bacterium]|nr:hypothetical protein [Chloroflexota bacterium]
MRRRGQVGQSIVVLAIGFIGLLGFVGIVTDVSLLFARYSTLRRAVDAAAVAAAGQLRRVADPTPGNPVAEDEAISVANVNLAARQFIELYGLTPSNVLVETCRAQRIRRIGPNDIPPAGTFPATSLGREIDRNDVELFLYNPGGQVTGPNPAANPEDLLLFEELCPPTELKLVRVTAQIDVQTVFMRLLGQPTVTLTEVAMSQTAVIDVVLIMDVSESMLRETTYTEWEDAGFGYRYLPSYLLGVDWNPTLYSMTEAQIQNDLQMTGMLGGLPFQAPQGFDSPTTPGQSQPRAECQVRTVPFFGLANVPVPEWLQLEYLNGPFGGNSAAFQNYFDGADAPPSSGANAASFNGMVPTYDYFGCCNDPNGDGLFDDLVCQPFREARDAAENFLSRLDFIRGDRVAYVTFDRQAHLIDPDGDHTASPILSAGPQEPMIEVENTFSGGGAFVPGDPLYRKGAIETLRNVVGVRAEPSSYVDSDNDGIWDAVLDGDTIRTFGTFQAGPQLNEIRDFPVARNCPYQVAFLPAPFRNPAADFDPATGLFRDPAMNPVGSPVIPETVLQEILTTPAWATATFPPGSELVAQRNSYEYFGSCRGTNIGGALGAGSEALFNNGRREGAVWIMVLLSDGAAGASNPVALDGAQIPDAPNPYEPDPLGSGFWAPLDGEVQPSPLVTITDGYGAFGLCPYGTAATPGESVQLFDSVPPFCSDEQPETRTYCYDTTIGLQPPDLQALEYDQRCIDFYDVDDYARDWADWVGLANLNVGAAGAGVTRVGDQQLPTIFTIGFGLNFDFDPIAGTTACAPTNYDCQRGLSGSTDEDLLRRQDYVGEELLRYIADVGDNFRVDNDYWQWHLGDRIPNFIDLNTPDWQVQGACQFGPPAPPPVSPLPAQPPAAFFDPVPPRQSCGNYYNAPTGVELDRAFNDIASRMFTRLSQ